MSQQALQPRALAGPLHRHANEAGLIYVLDGVIGAQLDGEVVHTEPGATGFVPRGASHTFWNETDERAEELEIFTPAELEAWFQELSEVTSSGSFDLDAIVQKCPPIRH